MPSIHRAPKLLMPARASKSSWRNISAVLNALRAACLSDWSVIRQALSLCACVVVLFSLNEKSPHSMYQANWGCLHVKRETRAILNMEWRLICQLNNLLTTNNA